MMGQQVRTQTGEMARIRLTAEQIEQCRRENDGVLVTCPLTGKDIFLHDKPFGDDPACPDGVDITPAVRPTKLTNGYDQFFTTAHTVEDVVIVLSATFEVRSQAVPE